MRHARRWAWLPVVLGIAVGWGAALLVASPSGRAADLADLGSSDATKRAVAISRLAESGASSALIDLRASEPGLARAGLIDVIRKAKPTSSDAPALRALIAHDDMGLRLAAAQSVQAVPQLLESELEAMLADTDEHPLLRAGAARSLAGLGAESRSALRAAALDGDAPDRVRRSALRALAECGSEGRNDVAGVAVDTTANRLDRQQAINVLALPSVKGRDQLAKLATHATAWIREFAVAGLGQIGNKADLTKIIAATNDLCPSTSSCPPEATKMVLIAPLPLPAPEAEERENDGTRSRAPRRPRGSL